VTPELPGGGKPVLLSTYFTGPNDGWAVGTPGVLVPTILHWDGVRWMPVTLSPALLGVAPPTIPPTLKSVYMTDSSSGWIVGSPIDFNQTFIGPTTTSAGTRPLASIFRFAPFGGVFGATSTTTVILTQSTSTTGIATSTSTQIIYTNTTTTRTTTSSVSGGGIPGFPMESIVAGIFFGLLALVVLRRRVTRGRAG